MREDKHNFMYVVSNHGVSEELIEEHWLQNKAFFSLPLKDKLNILADSNNKYVNVTAMT